MLSKVFRASKLLSRVSKATIPVRSLASTFMRFSSNTSLEKVDKVRSKLQKALQKELKYEEENYQKDDTVQNTLKETGFQLKDGDGDNSLELLKKVGNTSVVISFQSRPPPMNENEGEEGQEAEKKEGEEGEQDMQDFCEFTVYVISQNKAALAFECSSNDSEISINSITKVNDVEAHKKINRYERMANGYAGPDFSTLDDRLQASMMEYLKGYGVTEEVAALVEHLSLDKEQRLYMTWLKEVSDFIGSN